MSLLPVKIRWGYSPPNSILIVFEGLDGAGKTTQAQALETDLSRSGYRVLLTRQPTDTYRRNPIVQEYLNNGGPRSTVEYLAQLSARDRLFHINTVILPFLQKGGIVICDRYIYSAIALFHKRGLPINALQQLTNDVIMPSIVFFLDVTPTILLTRLCNRDGTPRKFEEKSLQEITSAREAYMKLSYYYNIIDGTLDPKQIQQQIMDKVSILLRPPTY